MLRKLDRSECVVSSYPWLYHSSGDPCIHPDREMLRCKRFGDLGPDDKLDPPIVAA